MRRAASAGSEPTTRMTCSCETSSSASTLRTRMAMSGKLGRSTLPLESSEANACTKANASASTVLFWAWAAAVFIGLPLESVAAYPRSTGDLSPVTGSRLACVAGDIHRVGQGEDLSCHIFERQDVLRSP